MTAIKELLRMLDERGVDYYYPHNYGGMVKWSDGVLTYHAANAFPCNDPTGKRLVMHVTYPTPEQAIEATLGRGTCKLTMNGTNGCFGCSECLENIPPLANFCPNCGREVTAR